MYRFINLRDMIGFFTNINEIFVIKTENKPIYTTPAPSNTNDHHYANAPKNSSL